MTALRADPQIRWSHGERRTRRRGHWFALAAALAMSAGLHAAAFIALAGRDGASLAPPPTVELASADSLASGPSGGYLAPRVHPDMRPAATTHGALASSPPPSPLSAVRVPAPSVPDAPRVPAMPPVAPPPVPRQAEAPSPRLSLATPGAAPALGVAARHEALGAGPSGGQPPGASSPPGPPVASPPASMPPPGPPVQTATSYSAAQSEASPPPVPRRAAHAGERRPAARARPGDAVASLPAVAASVGEDGGSSVAGGSAGASHPADTQAVPLPSNAPPPYPLAARRAQREGRALVRVLVARDGSGSDVRLAESSGTAALDMAALEAVRAWRFSPARRAGEATEDVILVPVTFRLTQ